MRNEIDLDKARRRIVPVAKHSADQIWAARLIGIGRRGLSIIDRGRRGR
jgi:hypothetical protein